MAIGGAKSVWKRGRIDRVESFRIVKKKKEKEKERRKERTLPFPSFSQIFIGPPPFPPREYQHILILKKVIDDSRTSISLSFFLWEGEESAKKESIPSKRREKLLADR